MSSSPAADAAPLAQVRFFLDAEADPGLLPRVLLPFARHGLTPDRMWSHRSDATMHVEIAVEATEEEAALVEGSLRRTVSVRRVSRGADLVARRAA